MVKTSGPSQMHLQWQHFRYLQKNQVVQQKYTFSRTSNEKEKLKILNLPVAVTRPDLWFCYCSKLYVLIWDSLPIPQDPPIFCFHSIQAAKEEQVEKKEEDFINKFILLLEYS